MKGARKGTKAVSRENALFGVDLADVLARQKARGLPAALPTVVTACIEYLSNHLDTDGLFRVPGADDNIQALKAEFDATGTASFKAVHDCHAVASLLKLYLRELPEPVLSYAVYPDLIAVFDGPKSPDKLARFRAVLLRLPAANLALLTAIVDLAVAVAAHVARNRMGIDNLVTVLGPNLLRSRGSTQADMMRDLTYANAIVAFIFKNHEALLRAPAATSAAGATAASASAAASDSAAPAADARPSSTPERAAAPDTDAAPSPASPSPTRTETTAMARLVDTSLARNLFAAEPRSPQSEDEAPESPVRRLPAAQAATWAGAPPKTWSLADLPFIASELDRLNVEVRVFEAIFAKRHGRVPRPSEMAPIQATLDSATALREAHDALTGTLRRTRTMLARPSVATQPAEAAPAVTQAAAPSGAQSLDEYVRNPLPAALARLREHRTRLAVPDDTAAMSPAQLEAEKSAIKQELRAFDSAFETRFGAPPRKADKEVLRPLYMRYREVRALAEAAGVTSPKDSPRSSTAESAAPQAPAGPAAAAGKPAPTAPTVSAAGPAAAGPAAPVPASVAVTAAPKASAAARPAMAASATAHRHETAPGRLAAPAARAAAAPAPAAAPTPAPTPSLASLKARKRELQVALHTYQEDFERRYGRKVQFVDDRLPIQAEYEEYKALKAAIARLEGAS